MISQNTFPDLEKVPISEAEVMTGDVLLCSGESTFSRLIQRATGSIWSHVAVTGLCCDVPLILESVESKGARTQHLANYAADPYDGRILLARHSDAETLGRHEFMAKGFEMMGSPYDKSEILSIAYRIMKGEGRGNEIRRDREYICSEFAWECLAAGGILIPYNERGFIAPSDFAQCSKLRPVVELVTMQA